MSRTLHSGSAKSGSRRLGRGPDRASRARACNSLQWEFDQLEERHLLSAVSLIKPISASNLTAVGGSLFFSASDGVHGGELWKSDGTPAGTGMVKDINSNGSATSNP